MRRLLAPLVIPLVLVIAACSSRPEFRSPALTRQQAMARTEVLELKVVKVWDVVLDALDLDRDPHVSHFIEVDVIAGSLAGRQLTLPLDHWSSKPPAEGSVVIVAPSDWVKPGRGGQSRPFGGW